VRVGRWLGTFAVLFIMTSTGQPGAQAAPLGGTTIGPVQISALGHPSLCWEAGGNGSGVTLEHCDRALQGQQWSLTPDGVLMNGNGYCLEAIPGRPLFIDFAAQCDGATSQLWHYHSAHLTSPVPGTSPTSGTSATSGTGTCAATAGPLVPGAEIVGSACSPSALAAGAVSRWSIGFSAVTVTPGRGHGLVGGTFGASVTVVNATSAQAAYGVPYPRRIRLRPARHPRTQLVRVWPERIQPALQRPHAHLRRDPARRCLPPDHPDRSRSRGHPGR
jgi:hypothetical protein